VEPGEDHPGGALLIIVPVVNIVAAVIGVMAGAVEYAVVGATESVALGSSDICVTGRLDVEVADMVGVIVAIVLVGQEVIVRMLVMGKHEPNDRFPNCDPTVARLSR
jgi:hypothetical protein